MFTIRHIKSAVIQYEAHYGIGICIGYDDAVWYGTTRNMGLEAVQMHQMLEACLISDEALILPSIPMYCYVTGNVLVATYIHM